MCETNQSDSVQKMEVSEETLIYKFKPFDFELIKANAASEIPIPRSGHRVLCGSKYLYLFGGYNPTIRNNSMVLNEFWRFNFITKIWQRRAESKILPKEAVSFATARKRQNMFVYGGTGVPFGFTSSNQLHLIDLNKTSQGFVKIKTFGRNKPPPQYGQAICINKNNLYVVGGTCGFEYNCNVYRLNLKHDKKVWKALYQRQLSQANEEIDNNNEPLGRYRHEIVCDGSNIYVIGGGTAYDVHDLVRIPTFNVAARSWQMVESTPDPQYGYPEARKCHGVVQVDTQSEITVYVMGGYQNTDIILNDLWKLQLPNLRWTLIKRNVITKGLYFHSTALSREGKLFIFGGLNSGVNLERSNEMYAGWVCIPKLSEIAWEAIVHYVPKQNLTRENLFKLRIPDRFVDRLS